MRSCEVSGKLEIRKWSRLRRCKREKEGRIKKQRKKKKTIVKHERGIVIILTFEFEHISRLLF
jgi:hypothetical protein